MCLSLSPYVPLCLSLSVCLLLAVMDQFVTFEVSCVSEEHKSSQIVVRALPLVGSHVVLRCDLLRSLSAGVFVSCSKSDLCS